MLRSDLMLDNHCCPIDSKCKLNGQAFCCWKQVELNTIASGFGWLGPASGLLHRSVFLTIGSFLSFRSELLIGIALIYNKWPQHSRMKCLIHEKHLNYFTANYSRPMARLLVGGTFVDILKLSGRIKNTKVPTPVKRFQILL